ncbi:MAG: hypothetical protein WC878_03525 [Candidatus Paceibacterota bacterium]|jgi:hypothetical protein
MREEEKEKGIAAIVFYNTWCNIVRNGTKTIVNLMEKIKMEHPPKSLRTDKLIDMTDTEGEKNEAVFRATEDIDRALADFPKYVGIIPFGSQTKGYNSKKNESDLDIYLLYDLTSEKEVLKMDEAIDAVKEKYKKSGVSIEIFHKPLDERFLFENHQIMSMFAQPGRGKRLQEWREKAKAIFANLDKDEQRREFENMLNGRLSSDRASCTKIRERFPDFDEEAWLNSRKKHWENKLRKLYFPNAQK